MFDKLKEKKLQELMFINKVEALTTEFAKNCYCHYVEDPGWSFIEEAPQFYTTLTRIPSEVRNMTIELETDDQEATYIETSAFVDISFYTADKMFHHEDDGWGQFRYSDYEDRHDSVKIGGWSRGDIMLADINVNVHLDDVSGYYDVATPNEDTDTQFKILISLDEYYNIDVRITNEYNGSDQKDFFVEVCDLEESDEDMGRILIDPNLPRTDLVKWFSSLLHAVDKVFGTKFESKDNIYFHPGNYNDLDQVYDEEE